MLKDLRNQSAQFEAELAQGRRGASGGRSGREGSHDYKHSPRGSNQNIVDYPSSDTARRYEPSVPGFGAPPGGYPSGNTPYGQNENPYGSQPGGYGPPQGPMMQPGGGYVPPQGPPQGAKY